jgi:hypothetical protein
MQIIRSGAKPRNRLLIVTPTLGIVRIEWAGARYGQVIPPNWSLGQHHIGPGFVVPMNYLVADAQNIGVQILIQQDYEWLFLHEDDVILPADCFLTLNEHMRKGTVPVVSGLYYLKADPTEPIVYRGRGNSCYHKFKVGDQIWVDGVPTGCLLIHRSILEVMYETSERYQTIDGQWCKRVFETPAKIWFDPESARYLSDIGTSDLKWCNRVMEERVLKKAGWPKIAAKMYPFLCDTRICCKHIDLQTGRQYP